MITAPLIKFKEYGLIGSFYCDVWLHDQSLCQKLLLDLVVNEKVFNLQESDKIRIRNKLFGKREMITESEN